MQGVIARGIKTPIIKAHDNLAETVTNAILLTATNENFEINDKDVIAITEGVVAIAANNYVTLDEVASDIKKKLNSDHIGLVNPIFSRNRFSLILKAIARSTKKITMLMPYPADEVGNPNVDKTLIDQLIIKDERVINDDAFYQFKHPFTKVNIINYYQKIVETENCKIEFIFSNNAKKILDYTNDIIVCEIHNRNNTKNNLKNSYNNVLTLSDIVNDETTKSGYNSKYGLLGSNVATFESLKLFPNDAMPLLIEIQNIIKEKTNKHVEVMVFGDGAFKDPSSGIWELADPVVSPFYTKGLIGSPSEVKIKMLVETKYKHLSGDALELAIAEEVSKTNKETWEMLGTTPRKYVDLLGSLADLIVGSGDKKTPVVLIQNYFK